MRGELQRVERRIENRPLPKYKPDAVMADFETRTPALVGLVFTYARLLKKKKKKKKKKAKKSNCHMSQKTFPIEGGKNPKRK